MLLDKFIEHMRKIQATIRYYLHIDPSSLTDEELARRYVELRWIREEEAKQNKKTGE